MPQIMAEVLDEGKKGDMEIVSMIRGQSKFSVICSKKTCFFQQERCSRLGPSL